MTELLPDYHARSLAWSRGFSAQRIVAALVEAGWTIELRDDERVLLYAPNRLEVGLIRLDAGRVHFVAFRKRASA